MEYTENYALTQWAADDRVLRTDFNANNQKVDTALKGMQTTINNSAYYVKLMDVTASANVTQVDLDMSNIDMKKYAEVIIYVDCRNCAASGSDYTFIRVNGISTGYRYSFDSDNNYLVNTYVQGNDYGGYSKIRLFPGTYLIARTESMRYSTTARGKEEIYGAAPISSSAVKTINFVRYSSEFMIPKNTRFIMYGVKL